MMMAQVSCLVLVGVPGAATAQLPEGAMPMRVTGQWSVEIGPGTVELGGRTVTLAEAVSVDVPPHELVTIEGERRGTLPVFNPDTAGWVKGAKLAKLQTQECSATGKLLPESVVVKAEDGTAFERGTDYDFDEFWGTIGRIDAGGIAADQPVLIDYTYGPDRLDSIVVDGEGAMKLLVGEPNTGAMEPPTPAEGETAIANVFLNGPTEELIEENLYPIEPLPALVTEPQAEELLPKTLAKLRAGEPVTVVAWGDSVTCGGGVGQDTESWWQQQFVTRLRERFSKGEITLLTAGWGGRNSRLYMDQPRGAEKDFVRDVLEPKPDLVCIEFVNDSGLNGEALVKQYDEIMGHMNGIGAEVILITPHLVRPDWLGQATMKFDEDPRPYVRDLKKYAADNGIGLADASALWCRLWREGIPYMTLEANSINHPDKRGHKLFADALMGVFPEE